MTVRGRLIAEIALILIAMPIAAAVFVRGCRGCADALEPERIVAEYPSPNRRLKLMVSMESGGATIAAVFDATIVASDATHSEPGCRVLTWETGRLTTVGEPVLDVAWSDDTRVVLTYPARLPVEHIVTKCRGVDVVHVQDSAEKGLRGYVCLDPTAKTFQPCTESREHRWSLLEAEKAKGWDKVTATLDPRWSAERASPLCRGQMAYVEVNGIVRPRTVPDAGADAWELTPTEFTFAGRRPRETCPQSFDPSHD
jgi:hypothetical protein